MLRRHASFSFGNYLGTAVGILPMTVVPLMVLSMRGPREAAWFAMAFLVAGFLNFIPSTSSQALFAEASRESVALRTQVGKAVRGIYTLLLPAIAIVTVGAPLILALFGPDYSEHATGALRALALSAVFAGGTYLVDAVLASRDRVVAYIFMNVVNAALVLGLVAMTLPDGLTNGALGWMAAQAASLVIGFGVLAVTGLWQPFPRAGRLPRRRAAAHDSILDNPAT
jgi:O-antigen/teichoic acid export membrane protein